MKLSRVISLAALVTVAALSGACSGSAAGSGSAAETRPPTATQSMGYGPWKAVKASTFYLGEEASDDNAWITNVSTAWSDQAVVDFGGIDRWGPKNTENWDGEWYKRNGFLPAGFTPKQNPFYLALPTPDHDEQGVLAAATQWVATGAKFLPELQRFKDGRFTPEESPFKNLWVQIECNGKTGYQNNPDQIKCVRCGSGTAPQRRF